MDKLYCPLHGNELKTRRAQGTGHGCIGECDSCKKQFDFNGIFPKIEMRNLNSALEE